MPISYQVATADDEDIRDGLELHDGLEFRLGPSHSKILCFALMGKRHTSKPPTKSGPIMDRAVFAEQLCAAHQRLWLLATALVGDRSQADDIVQEATMIAWKKVAEFRVGSNFAAWVAEIVRFCAMNHVRKRRSRNTVPTDPNSLDQLVVSDVMVPPPAMEFRGDLDGYQSHFDDDVLRALSAINPEARCCLLLRVVHQLSYAEISQVLQLPEGTAMSHVHRTKKTMRRRLQGFFRDSEQPHLEP